ncbi:MAG: hypothetical protein SOU05_02835 [Atopobium sp.]|uniref:hypothetical protein n=1 Tax=Atopobium sp. TaxID=1872650 RepID=UPI002A748CB1|nr:hypothetical protein [Atopobium sp.]MDY2788329.1 hypothetical protein [Atopobium sp.]
MITYGTTAFFIWETKTGKYLRIGYIVLIIAAFVVCLALPSAAQNINWIGAVSFTTSLFFEVIRPIGKEPSEKRGHIACIVANIFCIVLFVLNALGINLFEKLFQLAQLI